MTKKILYALLGILLLGYCSYFSKEKEDNTLRNLGILSIISSRNSSSTSCSGDSGMIICIPRGIAE
jgi:hypothetical protein